MKIRAVRADIVDLPIERAHHLAGGRRAVLKIEQETPVTSVGREPIEVV